MMCFNVGNPNSSIIFVTSDANAEVWRWFGGEGRHIADMLLGVMMRDYGVQDEWKNEDLKCFGKLLMEGGVHGR